MAGVTCPSCKTLNADGEVLCSQCGFDLAEADAGFERPAPVGVQAEPSMGTAPPNCPFCGAEVPDPANLVCVVCLERLSAPCTGPTPPTPLRLRLLFAGQVIGVPVTETVLLGRDETSSPYSALFAERDNVSRRHASVGVHADGAAWVRDEGSTNGTYVNGVRVTPGTVAPLVDGDVLRIASDVSAQVELDRGDQV